MRTLIGLVLGLSLVFSGARPAGAVSLAALNLQDLAQQADLIFAGRLLEARSGPDGWSLPSSWYTFRVEQVIKGRLQPGQTFTFKRFGSPLFPGLPHYERGRRYVLFLTGQSSYGFRSTVGAGQGAFALYADGAVQNAFANAGLLRSTPGLVRPSGVLGGSGEGVFRPLYLADLVAAIGSLPGVQPQGESRPSLAGARGTEPVPAANPLEVNQQGQAYVWDVPTATHFNADLERVPYNPDQGTLGLLSNAEAQNLVGEAFAVWSAVPTTFLAFQNAGPLPVDVNGWNFTSFLNDSNPTGPSPIIFDSDGSITDALNGTGAACSILGFAGPLVLTPSDSSVAYIQRGVAVLNGLWIDGQSNQSRCGGQNTEISVEKFKGVFVHEFGHYLGLGHTQVNGNAFLNGEDVLGHGTPPLESLATMFPLILGQDLASLQRDDEVAISALYPNFNFPAGGTISGSVWDTDGLTPFRCANVIARSLTDPFFTAVSNVSGARFTFAGNSTLKGVYEILSLPFGDYAVELDQINPIFTGGSSLGTCSQPAQLPGPEEFYNGSQEGHDPAVDDPGAFTPVPVNGAVGGIDLVLNSGGNTISATRTIAPAALGAGETFSVHIVVHTPQALQGMLIQEHLPDGWVVTGQQGSLNAIFNDSNFSWLFLATVTDGATLDYTVQIPAGAAAQSYTITGTLQSASPAVQLDIGGDAQLEVIQCVPVRQVVAGLNDPLNLIETPEILQAVGWWLDSTPVSSSCEGLISTETVLNLVAYWTTQTAVDQPLPAAVLAPARPQEGSGSPALQGQVVMLR